MKSETLVVVAYVDDRFAHFRPTIKGGRLALADTSAGGHPSAAFVRAYEQHPDFHSYLFLQDSLRGTVDDVVKPFRDYSEEHGYPVVAWGFFPMFFDNGEQQNWVESQYAREVRPRNGIFGPIFYATNDAMRQAKPFFPRSPENRLQAQGTERAWAYTFEAAGVPFGALGAWSNEGMASGNYPVFQKVFANRP